jgi:hypothetical protein
MGDGLQRPLLPILPILVLHTNYCDRALSGIFGPATGSNRETGILEIKMFIPFSLYYYGDKIKDEMGGACRMRWGDAKFKHNFSLKK